MKKFRIVQDWTNSYRPQFRFGIFWLNYMEYVTSEYSRPKRFKSIKEAEKFIKAVEDACEKKKQFPKIVKELRL